MFLSSARNLDKAGAKMVIMNPQPLVKQSLTTAGIDKVIAIVTSEQEALAAVGAA
jgi:anti-anti-sigma regulatory factor